MPRSDPRVLVLGAGSIGSRHARNLAAAGATVDIADPEPTRPPDGVTPVVYDLNALGSYDGVVIASPSALHREQALWALDRGAHVLVEKPLAVSLDGLDDLVDRAEGRVMVGYNLRFHTPVQDFVALAHSGVVGQPLSARAWFGSWLPDWRPDVDYRGTYSARAALGGGVLADAIHELDMLIWLFPGEFEVVGAMLSRLGPLEIDVEDTVTAVLRHDSGVPISLSLDYLSRRYRRGLEVTGSEATIRLDWARGTIERETADDVVTIPADDDVAESYVREASCFLEWVRGRGEPPVDATDGAASVRLAAAIRRAAS